MNVYLVTDGDYSDYHVIGVYSTEENAEWAAKCFGGVVAEMTLDPDIEQMHSGRTRWRVTMRRDGSVVECHEGQHTMYFALWEDFSGAVFLAATVWAKSKEHAIKITSEVRRQLLAADAWPERLQYIPCEVRVNTGKLLEKLTAEVAEVVGE